MSNALDNNKLTGYVLGTRWLWAAIDHPVQTITIVGMKRPRSSRRPSSLIKEKLLEGLGAGLNGDSTCQEL